MKRAWIVVLAAACGGDGAAPPDEVMNEDSLMVLEALSQDTATVPLVPPHRSGSVAMAGTGGHPFSAVNTASATRCADSGLLEITGRSDTMDVILLLRTADPAETAYAIHPPTDSFPPGSARTGMLLARGRTGFVFQGIAGSVTLDASGRRVSGTFEMLLQETALEQVTRVHGAFTRIAVNPASAALCQLNLAIFTPDSTAADSLSDRQER